MTGLSVVVEEEEEEEVWCVSAPLLQAHGHHLHQVASQANLRCQI
jgi:DNA-binding IclR family transcriptional regulator